MRPKREIDVAWLRNQLLEEGKTYKDVGEEIGVTKEMVRQYCLEYEIHIKDRTARWYAKRLGIPELETQDWLLKQKENDNLGIENLAEKLGIPATTFEIQMMRLGLNPEDFKHRAKTVTLPCGYCVKPVTRRASETAKRGYKQVFCDGHCKGKWLGENFGFGVQEGTQLWKPEEEEFLQKNWQQMADEEIASHLGRTPLAVERRRQKLGFLKVPSRKDVKLKKWEEDEVYFLRKYYFQRTAKWIGEILGRSENSVQGKVLRLGLRKSSRPD